MEHRPSRLVLPGLGDDVKWVAKQVEPMQQHFDVITHSANWGSHELVEEKVQRIRATLRNLQGTKKGLIGISASGHLSLAVAITEEVTAVSAVSARLRLGEHVFPTARQAAWRHPTFYSSLCKFEQEVLPNLGHAIKSKALTTRGSPDWMVPPATSFIEGIDEVIFNASIFNAFNHRQNIRRGLQSSELFQFFLAAFR